MKKIKLFVMVMLSVTMTNLFHAQIANASGNQLEPWINSAKFNSLAAASSSSGFCFFGGVSSKDNVVDGNLNNFATMSVLVGAACTRTIAVKDNTSSDTYPAGTYAGYVFDASGLISLSVFPTITITTYNNKSRQENVASITSLIGLQLFLLDGGKAQVGGVATKPFDEIRISIGSLLGVSTNTRVMYPVVKRYQTGPALLCNNVTRWTNTEYPVEIESSRTGVSGIALGSVSGTQNVISASTADYAVITMTAGVFGSSSLSVKDQLSTYPAGSYAGYELSSAGISVEFLSGYSIVTYLDGKYQQSYNPTEFIDILDIPGRKRIGFVTSKPFDEVQLKLNQFAGVNIGLTHVYNVILYKACALIANADNFTVATGESSTTSVLSNDIIKGNPTNLTNVILTQISSSNAGITLDPNTGLINVAGGTPAGDYTLDYKICDMASPSICSEPATVTITVPTPAILAVADTYSVEPGKTTTTSVLSNDTFNGNAATVANVTLSQTSTNNAGVNIDTTTGNITVATGTPAGDYTVNYQICDLVNPSNCSTSTANVNVINMTKPDLMVKASASRPYYKPLVDLQTFYKVSNIGDADSFGPITLTVTIVADPGTISYTLPQGWVLSSNVGTVYTFTTNKSFNPSDNDTVIITYNCSGTAQSTTPAVFNAVITTGSGGETNGANNSSSMTIFRNSSST